MSEYVVKQEQIEWLEICESDALVSASDYDMGMAKAFRIVKEKLQSGAFDISDEDGEPIDFFKEINTAYGLASKHRDDVQRLRAAFEQIIAAYEGEGTDIQVARKMVRIAREALSTTEPTGAERVREMYDNANHLNSTTSGATAEFYLGVMNGITDTLNTLGITIPGINAPEKEADHANS